jgi:hypothetical protein
MGASGGRRSEIEEEKAVMEKQGCAEYGQKRKFTRSDGWDSRRARAWRWEKRNGFVGGRRTFYEEEREERCVLAGRFCVEIDYLIFH